MSPPTPQQHERERYGLRGALGLFNAIGVLFISSHIPSPTAASILLIVAGGIALFSFADLYRARP